MSDDLRLQDSTTPDRQTTLDDVVNQVRQDSRRESDDYLDQTIVPHGGE